MAFDPLTAILDFSGTVIDKIFPDKAEAERAKLKVLELQRSGELKELETRYSAIIAEASSSDPWTSRARPSFLYVIYLLLLASIPYGIAFAMNPEAAGKFAQGVGTWFTAIPDELYALFGAGYLGYGFFRSRDKKLTQL